MEYGPVKDAPNPVQRELMRRPLLLWLWGAILIDGVFLVPVMVVLVLFGGLDVWVAAAGVVVLSLGIWAIGTLVVGTGTFTREGLEKSMTAYVPWFRSPRTPTPRSAWVEPSGDEVAWPRGRLVDSPSRLQRLEIRWLFPAKLLQLAMVGVGPTVLVAFRWWDFGDSTGVFLVTLWSAILVGAVFTYLRSPLRGKSSDDREATVVNHRPRPRPWTYLRRASSNANER